MSPLHLRRLIVVTALVLLAVLAPVANAQSGSSLQWHSIDKPVMVEDMTEFSVWLIGYRDGQPSAVTVQLVRANANVPALLSALKSKSFSMIATAPMNTAIHVRGIRVLYGTKTIREGRAESPLMEQALRVEAGRAVGITYNLTTGAIVFTPIGGS